MTVAPRIAVLIVAAGSGSRLGGVPKQYRMLAGHSVLRRSIDAFRTREDVTHLQVVIGTDHAALYAAATAGLMLPPPVIGGATRQESVRRGLEAIGEVDIVLIHDAARPLVSQDVISGVIAALSANMAATPALPVTDSLRRGDTHIAGDVSRDHLHTVQTPQGFHFTHILAAHRAATEVHTDDAAIAHAAGHAVALTPGDPDNFKITVEADLMRAEKQLTQHHKPRTAMGYDVHRFGEGDHIMLGGIKIPHSHGIIAHSDGDVALHALTDALLGSLAMGDIGTHFPPSDPQWKNAASADFLIFARDAIHTKSGTIAHVDLTLVCERPKITPHRDAIRQSIAMLLKIDISSVSVKATTTEGLGFTGRAEGIAAQAVATVLLP
jgi:2-C-methyl-D-erythritol 4-phosphate cytidylyltransferase / 2-C-methyl-D-erythritol 2,4-cyclodiphosphate synthase